MVLPKVLPQILSSDHLRTGAGALETLQYWRLWWVTTHSRGPTGDSGQIETSPYLVSGLERRSCRCWHGLQGL